MIEQEINSDDEPIVIDFTHPCYNPKDPSVPSHLLLLVLDPDRPDYKCQRCGHMQPFLYWYAEIEHN